jgi:hypothetical protein
MEVDIVEQHFIHELYMTEGIEVLNRDRSIERRRDVRNLRTPDIEP